MWAFNCDFFDYSFICTLSAITECNYTYKQYMKYRKTTYTLNINIFYYRLNSTNVIFINNKNVTF